MENTTKLFFLLFLLLCSPVFAQGNGKFKVVLDAGHGGKDSGATYHGFTEKDITLNVALRVGKILEQANDVQVVYTRKTDVFIELTERPNMANKAKAAIFVSIHCNGETKKTAYGTETFVMGPTKNASNMDVAKKENSVIKFEKDYKVKYAGFDPNAPETIIGIGIQQEVNKSQSIDLASKIQDGLTDVLKRKNRGVKYAPFWVLHKTAMPSILIELGFVSYRAEGAYLSSEDGQDNMARTIAGAILSYKKEYFAGESDDYKEPAKPVMRTITEDSKPADGKEPDTKPAAITKGIVFKVQIAASDRVLKTVSSNFKGLKNITKDSSTAVIKYFYGSTSQYSEAKELLETAKAKGYTSAFVVAFKNGKKIKLQEALK